MTGNSWMLTLAIGGHSFRLVRRDVPAFIILIFIPLLILVFTGDAFRGSLVQKGYASATGAEQSVSSMAVLFAFFIVPQAGFLLFQEHSWGTWQRLQLAGASLVQIYLGKALVPLLLFGLQFAVLFGYAALVADIDLADRAAMLLAIGASYACCVVALAFFLFAISNSFARFAAFANLSAIALSGLGGAFTIETGASGWLAAIGPFTPGYWAMNGYRDILLGTANATQVATAVVILLGFAVAFGILSSRLTDLAVVKEG